MGSKGSKQHHAPAANKDLSSEEIEHLQKMYKMSRLSSVRNSVHKVDNLANSWKQYAGEDLIALFNDFLCNEEGDVPFEKFGTLFIKLVKSPCEETAEFIIELLRQNNDVTYNAVLMYVKNVISSYFMTLTTMEDDVLHEWTQFQFVNSEDTQMLFAESLCQDLKVSEGQDFVTWYTRCAQFQKLHSTYVHKLFRVPGKQVIHRHETIEKHLLPTLSEPENLKKGELCSVLSLAEILFLNSYLPEEKQFEWKLCFSTSLHGLAFGKMSRMIIDKGPNIIIIKDKIGHKFGGYASSSWKIAPSFQGTEESFLFSLHPVMKIYESTGYNNHYQYLNSQQQTLPNGLGMGGQFEYFGFWLDADFGKGHSSESCTTYKNYKMLSSRKDFDIDHVEVWSVERIKKDEDEEEEGHESILDKDAGAKALLEIAGRQMASDGYREESK